MTTIISQFTTWMDTVFFNNTLGNFLISLAVFVILLLGLSLVKKIVVSYLGKLAQKTVSDFDDLLVRLVSQIGWPVITVVALYVATSSLVMTEGIRSLIRNLTIFVVTFRVILLVQNILQYAVNKILIKRVRADNPSSQAMVNSVVWIIKWVLWALGSLFILDNLGVNISSLVAGIGIGGIAVAMASQAVLGDAFSALCIYLDKPFEIGDFIIIDEYMGTVENIGLKTTRIKSLSGEQLVFANADLTKSRIKNYKRMQTRRIVFKLGVVYQTSIDKVKRIPVMIKEILTKTGVQCDRVHFQSFGDSALIFEVVYFVLSADYNVYMDKQQAINYEIMKEFDKEGIDFAYPTQTLYMKNEK